MFSILFEQIPETNFAEEQAFKDINADRIFNEKVRKILCYNITESEIKARTEFFSQLRKDDNAEKLSILGKDLTELERLKAAYYDAESKIEVLFIARTLCDTYCRAVKRTLNLALDGKFITELKKEAEKLLEDVEEMSEMVRETEEAFNTVKNWRLSFGGSGLVFMKRGSAEHEGIFNKLIKSGKELNIVSESFRTDANIKVPAELSDKLLDIYRDEVKKLTVFVRKYNGKINFDILKLKEEIDFYLTMKKLYDKAENRKIISTNANISKNKEFRAIKAYDITLLENKETEIVPNDIDFTEEDSVCFLTGANGGGKTTYLRNIAVNMILALSGFPVFAEKCSIYHFRKIYSHFPVDESFTDSGRLKEEENRANGIIENADKDTFILFNETYSGTDSVKGTGLALEAAAKALEKGAFMLFVTHFYDVTESNFTILQAVVEEGNNNQRTYKIRKGMNKRASFANDILDKYGLSLKKLKERFGEDFEA